MLDYSRQFQAHAADELQRLGPPCPRDVVIEGCSAVARMILDYGDTRNRIRAIKG